MLSYMSTFSLHAWSSLILNLSTLTFVLLNFQLEYLFTTLLILLHTNSRNVYPVARLQRIMAASFGQQDRADPPCIFFAVNISGNGSWRCKHRPHASSSGCFTPHHSRSLVPAEHQERTSKFEGLSSSDEPGIGVDERIPAPGRTGFPAGALLTAS